MCFSIMHICHKYDIFYIMTIYFINADCRCFIIKKRFDVMVKQRVIAGLPIDDVYKT